MKYNSTQLVYLLFLASLFFSAKATLCNSSMSSNNSEYNSIDSNDTGKNQFFTYSLSNIRYIFSVIIDSASFSFGFGPSSFKNAGPEALSYNFSGGWFWQIHRFSGVKILGEISSDFSKSTLLRAELEGDFFPLKTDIQPYTGLKLGIGQSVINGGKNTGFTAGATAGVIFFKTSKVRLVTETSAITILNKKFDKYPVVYSFILGLIL
jgi:hypothetical protein